MSVTFGEYVLHVHPVKVCTAHQWYTPVDDEGGICASHGDLHIARRYEVVDQDGRYAYTSIGDIRVYKSYSSAYSYCRRFNKA